MHPLATQALPCIVALVLAALGFFVLHSQPGNKIHRRFAGHTFLLIVWTMAIAGVHGKSHLEFWGRLTFAATSLILPTFLIFCRYFPSSLPWLHPGLVRLMAGTGIAFATVAMSSPLIAYDFSTSTGELTRKAGPLYPAFAAFMVAWSSIAIACALKKWREARGRAHTQSQFLGTRVILFGSLAITTNLLLPFFTAKRHPRRGLVHMSLAEAYGWP